MTVALRRCVCLLRGINVGRGRRIPMGELRALCERIGWRDVRTYIQSGNIVFRATGAPAQLERDLEDALPGSFGVAAAVIVRDAEDWNGYVAMNPFSEEARVTPSLVMLALSKAPPADDAVMRLEQRASSERVARVGDVLWIHYPNGAGRSRLGAGSLDAAAGSAVTTRNWRTVLELDELARRLPKVME